MTKSVTTLATLLALVLAAPALAEDLVGKVVDAPDDGRRAGK